MKKRVAKTITIVVAVLMFVPVCFGMTGCGYCAHQLDVIDKVDSTCIEHGHAYSYECKKCGKLFAYSVSNGLYEINEAEELPLSEHIISTGFGARLKDGKTEAASVFDYEITTSCGLCEEEYAVPNESLVSVVPPTRTLSENSGSRRTYKGERIYNEEVQRWYTSIQFYKATRPGDITTLDPWNDKGWDGKYGASQRLPIYIPFDTDVPRYVVFIVHNTDEDNTIKLEWSIDRKQYSGVTVAPGEYKPLVVTGSRNVTNVDGQYVRVSNAAGGETLGANIVVEMTGAFYTAGTVENLTVDSQPVKSEYAAGEYFDGSGMQIYATYTDYCLGKTLIDTEYTLSTQGRTLTADDDRVVISYGGKSVSVPITVT